MSIKKEFKFADCRDCVNGVGKPKAICLTCEVGEHFEERAGLEEMTDADLFQFISEQEDSDD